MNLSPVEAINRVGESVTVVMTVQRTKQCSGSRLTSGLARLEMRGSWCMPAP